MQMENRVALVTGAGQGIGRAIAVRLADAGAKIIVEDQRDSDQVHQTLSDIRKAGSDGCVILGDVSNGNDVRSVIAQGIEKMGHIDVLVNNAGVERNAPFLEVSEEDFDLVMDVNLKGAFFMSQAFARYIKSAKRKGRIVNISSVHEELPFPHFTSYCASKGGMKMMMRNLAIELAPFGINVNNVAPGAIVTSINSKLMQNPDQLAALTANIPLDRLGAPRDVANAVLFLASAESDYITGTTVFVDGGLLWNYAEQ